MKRLPLDVAKALTTVPCDVLHFYVYNEVNGLGFEYFNGFLAYWDGKDSYVSTRGKFCIGDINHCDIYLNFKGETVKEIYFLTYTPIT